MTIHRGKVDPREKLSALDEGSGTTHIQGEGLLLTDEIARPLNPYRLVTEPADLDRVSRELAEEPFVGLDVETTLRDHAVCLVQVSTLERTLVFDALALRDLTPLNRFLASLSVVKIIHNAAFERRALARRGVLLENIFDTLPASRRLRGHKIPGGHGLAAVCSRELGYRLDKTEQCSDWQRRPLRQSQLDYAALDAEVLISLYTLFARR